MRFFSLVISVNVKCRCTVQSGDLARPLILHTRCNRPEFSPSQFFSWGKTGGPILSPPQLVKTSTIPCHEHAKNFGYLGGGEKLGQLILSPPRQNKTSALCRWLSGWRKTLLVCYFPILTSESITLPCHEYMYNLCLLGGGGKLGWPILSPPWPIHSSPRLVKVSTLPCQECANNLCFLGGGEKLGGPILYPP